MHTELDRRRARSSARGAVDRDRLIQATAIVFTLAVALACSGKGSSGSSGHKKKKDRDPPTFSATEASDTAATQSDDTEPIERVRVSGSEAPEPVVDVTLRRRRAVNRARDRGR